LSRRWRLPPQNLRFPLRSACLAEGSLPRATKHLAGGGCRPHVPAFRCARLVLQAACYRGQRSAWQAGLPPPHPRFPLRSTCLADGSLPRATKIELPCRGLATAGSEAFGRWGLPPLHPRFPLRSACLADTSLPRATKRLLSCARTCALVASNFSRRRTNEMAVEIVAFRTL
jgi:hypothetical protein